MTKLLGKNALVTGASRGIGRAVALALSRAGASTLVHYSNSEKVAAEVVAEISAAGGVASAIKSDLRSPQGPHELAAEVRASFPSRLDILVLNAGISHVATLEQATVEDFDELFAVNVRAPFFLVQQLLPILKEEASVILISSLAARSAFPKMAAYAASKGAVETLVLQFAAALGPRGVRVNGIAPGVVRTEGSTITKTDEGINATVDMQALKRIAEPADIAELAVFLASNDSRWVTGAIVPADGGSKL